MRIGKALLRIGQVAELSGLSSRTIDYYTQHGLLEYERSSSNYRLYPESVLQTLERIKLLKKQRMSIAEIKEAIQTDNTIEPIIVEVQDEITCLQQKLTTLEEQMKDAPREEKKLIYQKLESKLTDVMKLLTLM
ncbi:MerR family transcriptional regulator [Domibacillus antri]|uniref:MerR family transcriptional regulator n=1 Tax=Domibacillus antri TaxID=1714264 RepID=A0A1Q8Q4Z7_9BACI|nr:MerR family transcriptional regulator [Domibacillus antri]OLN22420.1 MerR family transcriptional regulator [Domibacillus antri]